MVRAGLPAVLGKAPRQFGAERRRLWGVAWRAGARAPHPPPASDAAGRRFDRQHGNAAARQQHRQGR